MALSQCFKDCIAKLSISQRVALLALLNIKLDVVRARFNSLTILVVQENILAIDASTILDSLLDELNVFITQANKVPFQQFRDCSSLVELSKNFQDIIRTKERRIKKASIVAEEATGRQPANEVKTGLSEEITSLEEQAAYLLGL